MKEKIYEQLLHIISINTSEIYSESNKNNAKTLHYISGYNDAIVDVMGIINDIERERAEFRRIVNSLEVNSNDHN